jgi:hypothetical protein
MQKIILSFALVLFSICSLQAQKTTTTNKLLRHVVLFSFKAGSTPEQIKEVTDAFVALPKKIKTIKVFEWGTNISPENLNQGFTHCFFVSFASEKDRDAYLPHADHQAFVKIVTPVLDKVLVVDYWSK